MRRRRSRPVVRRVWGCLRFLEIGGDIERVQRHKAQQRRAGLNIIADPNLAITDNAVDRRTDHGVSLILQ